MSKKNVLNFKQMSLLLDVLKERKEKNEPKLDSLTEVAEAVTKKIGFNVTAANIRYVIKESELHSSDFVVVSRSGGFGKTVHENKKKIAELERRINELELFINGFKD